MLSQKLFMLFFACLLIIAPKLFLNQNGVEATRVLTIHKGRTKRQDYATLGLVCKCCDGKGGECRSTWDDACSNLLCNTWKY